MSDDFRYFRVTKTEFVYVRVNATTIKKLIDAKAPSASLDAASRAPEALVHAFESDSDVKELFEDAERLFRAEEVTSREAYLEATDFLEFTDDGTLDFLVSKD